MTLRPLLIGLAVVLLPPLAYFFVGVSRVHPDTVYGVTWSMPYAEELGIDGRAGFLAVLDDLGMRRVRIPSYWSRMERERGLIDTRELQWQLDELAKRNGKAIVVVGATQPRWPECWVPGWVEGLTQVQRETAQLQHVRDVVGRFARHPAIEMWQVENEPGLLFFGNCKDQRPAFIRQEMQEVRNIEMQMLPEAERHPVTLADSGELSTWLAYARELDTKGVSVYRKVLAFGTWPWRYWFIPPYFYARKAALVKPWIAPIYVSEFQMEPWATKPLRDIPLEEQLAFFGMREVRENLAYAERLGMHRVDFWGAEWWYWLKTKQERPEIWQEMKRWLETRKRE